MKHDIFSPQEREIIEARKKRPPEERFAALVKKGIIDEEGKVLVRMPPVDGSDDWEAEEHNEAD